jgi:molybdopterin synthase sulfur carrier subunit
MPSIRVLYFAGLREAVGCSDEELELSAGMRTVGDLCEALALRHTAYREARAQVRVAHNEVFASGAEPLADGDVVALIPPVAGG